MPTPTKTTTITDSVIEEVESKCSVEITNTIKDGPRISIVKAYANTVEEAAQEAIAGYKQASAALKAAL